VRTPKGFGKNYFTFSSVLAHSVQNDLQSQISRASTLTSKKYADEEDALQEEEPSCELLEALSLQSQKPCHCNCFYNLKTRLALLINHFIPRCPYYTVCFAFRRTGVHPPL